MDVFGKYFFQSSRIPGPTGNDERSWKPQEKTHSRGMFPGTCGLGKRMGLVGVVIFYHHGNIPSVVSVQLLVPLLPSEGHVFRIDYDHMVTHVNWREGGREGNFRETTD